VFTIERSARSFWTLVFNLSDAHRDLTLSYTEQDTTQNCTRAYHYLPITPANDVLATDYLASVLHVHTVPSLSFSMLRKENLLAPVRKIRIFW